MAGSTVEAGGTRAFEPVQPARHESTGRASQETRLFTQPPAAQPAARRQEPAQEDEADEEAGATRAVRSDDRTRWADQPVRRVRPIPEEDEEDGEDDRDPVAENIIRWVPPLTALICAGIALYGFVYYQFFL